MAVPGNITGMNRRQFVIGAAALPVAGKVTADEPAYVLVDSRAVTAHQEWTAAMLTFLLDGKVVRMSIPASEFFRDSDD